MKKPAKIAIQILFLALISLSAYHDFSIAKAQTGNADNPTLDYGGLVKCDGVVNKNEPDRQRVCDFIALMDTIKSLINWAFVMSLPIATALFAWAGLLYITGTPGNIKKAKSIFSTTAIGFIIMIVAWLSIRTLVDWLVKSEFGATLFLGK